jgi:Xaa-Pro aminopeptidase
MIDRTPTTTPPPQIGTGVRTRLVAARIQAIRNILHTRSARGILLDARRDFAWLTLGGQNHILYTTETGVAPILVALDDAVVLAPVNEFDRINDEEIDGLPLRIESAAWWDNSAANERAAELVGDGRVLKPADCASELTALRSVLDPVEHERMTWLASVINEVVSEITARVVANGKARTNEDDLVAWTMAAFAEKAVRLPVVLVASDERIERYRHPLPITRPIERRVMLVVVAERWGLHVAHTQFMELEPRSSELAERAAAISDVLDAMREATTPGNTLGDVLAAARAAYDRAGMGEEWSLHHQGGSIGYQAREQIATPNDATPIVPGMAFAWNPSTVGFKREETLYLDADGTQVVLTTTP